MSVPSSADRASALALGLPPRRPLIEMLEERGGFYRCPKTPDGKRLGPLVGFTGRYDDGTGQDKQFVGDDYLNCAVLEEDGGVLGEVADMLIEELERQFPDLRSGKYFICGIPEGGRSLAAAIALAIRAHHGYLEKIIVEQATGTSREKTALRFRRHVPKPGQMIIGVEDISNNLSSPDQVAAESRKYGADMVGIATLVNRSPMFRTRYERGDLTIPIVAIVNESMPEYQQDDPAVAEDIRAGNVVWSPKSKPEWAKLMKAMRTSLT